MTSQISKKQKPSFFLVTTGYAPALEYFGVGDTGEGYDALKEEVSEKLLDVAHLYAKNLRKFGYRVQAVLADNEFLQKKWAKEQRLNFSNFEMPHLARRYRFVRSIIGKLPKLYYSFKNFSDKSTWNWQILMAQIRRFHPDILFVFDMHYLAPKFLEEVRPYVKKIVGDTCFPIFMQENHFKKYDFIFSSLPHYVENFRKMGVQSALTAYAFEPAVLGRIGPQKRIHDCVYVGGLSRDVDKTSFFEELAKKVKVKFWGHMNPPLPAGSAIMTNYQGQAWGIDTLKILGQSKIVINCHVQKHENYESPFANNMRLFEATGMGALLITDWKENLADFFKIGKEVVAYKTVEEAAEKIKYYLKHEKAREKIAKAGQKRTLREHTYEKRVKNIIDYLNLTQ